VCPYTKNADYTPIPFFNTNVITTLNTETLNALDDEAFKARPFAWRGRDVIERNVKLLEGGK
jgi:hypothetical protein